jgi:hypothetical protein
MLVLQGFYSIQNCRKIAAFQRDTQSWNQPWRWSLYVSQKHWRLCPIPHGAKAQKIIIIILVTMRTSKESNDVRILKYLTVVLSLSILVYKSTIYFIVLKFYNIFLFCILRVNVSAFFLSWERDRDAQQCVLQAEQQQLMITCNDEF